MKKRIGFDSAVDCIKVDQGVKDWVCKECGQKNMKDSDFNDITSCSNCGRLVMLKRR